MGCGSPLCAKLHERIVSQFKDNVSLRKIAKNLVSFTIHSKYPEMIQGVRGNPSA